MNDDSLIIDGVSLRSRLFLGTGKFSSVSLTADALESSDCEVVTVALRRVNLSAQNDSLLTCIDQKRYRIMPNTSGARNSEEALRLARLIKALGRGLWIKLEVIADSQYLLPDQMETLKAAEILVREGFKVFPYIQPDPLLARQLQDVGCSAVMPLAAPIGTNKGLRSRDLIQCVLQKVSIPVVVDAGLGLPSHASEAMEMGVDAVLVNTAIATAKDPVLMAKGFARAVEAGRLAYRSGQRAPRDLAEPSSPLTQFLYQ